MAKKKKKTTGGAGNLTAAEPGLVTAAPVAAPAAPAMAAPPPAESEITLSWRWHVTTLVVITAVILAVFFTYRWFIRAWADDRLALASGYLELAPQLKGDYLSRADGYSPVAQFVEGEMAATVEFQSTLIDLHKELTQAGVTVVTPQQKDLIRTRRTNLLRLANEVLAHPPHQLPPVLANELDHGLGRIRSVVEKIEPLETSTFSSSQELSDAIWQCQLSLNELILKTFPYLRGMFDYMAALDMAVLESRRAVGSDNAYPAAFDVLARALEEQGLLEDAADQFVAVVELEPRGARADEIIAAYEKQAAEVPADLNAHYALGRFYRARDERDKALAELGKVIELDGGKPDEPQTYTGYLARKVYREVFTGERDEFAPGREG